MGEDDLDRKRSIVTDSVRPHESESRKLTLGLQLKTMEVICKGAEDRGVREK